MTYVGNTKTGVRQRKAEKGVCGNCQMFGELWLPMSAWEKDMKKNWKRIEYAKG